MKITKQEKRKMAKVNEITYKPMEDNTLVKVLPTYEDVNNK